jgi:hypothetical protein
MIGYEIAASNNIANALLPLVYYFSNWNFYYFEATKAF